MFDIGQNDVSVGFRNMINNEQFQADIKDMINQLATAVRVSI